MPPPALLRRTLGAVAGAMTHVVEIRPGCTLTVIVHDDVSLTGEVDHPNLSVAARNPDTLFNTLADYGVEMPEELRETLWRDVRNANFRRVESLPADAPERLRAQAVVDRLTKAYDLGDAA